MTLMPVSNILSLGGLLLERRRRAVDRPALGRRSPGWSGKSTGSPSTFSTRPSVAGPTGIVMRLAEVDGRHAALQAVGGLHRDGAHAVLAQVLLHLGDDVDLSGPGPSALIAQRVVDRRQVPALELDVDDRPDDLDDAARLHCG